MKLTKEQYKNLQEQWYSKLAESGFVDIELHKDNRLVFMGVLLGEDFLGIEFDDAQVVQAKQIYFTLLSERTQDERTTFKSLVDRHILQRHAEGALVKTIVEELLALGTPRDRKSVRIIIRRYEVEWDIRYYTSRQLNKKHG